MYNVERLIDLETARLAKKLGFHEKTWSWYMENPRAPTQILITDIGEGQWGDIDAPDDHNSTSYVYTRWSAPSQAMMQDWIMERGFFIDIRYSDAACTFTDIKLSSEPYFFIVIFRMSDRVSLIIDNTEYKRYNDALNSALMYGLLCIQHNVKGTTTDELRNRVLLAKPTEDNDRYNKTTESNFDFQIDIL